MQAMREIARPNSKYYHLTLPEWAIGRDIEVIVLPVVVRENELREKRSAPDERMGPLSVLGYAKTFRTTRTTAEWMQDLRDGESV